MYAWGRGLSIEPAPRKIWASRSPAGRSAEALPAGTLKRALPIVRARRAKNPLDGQMVEGTVTANRGGFGFLRVLDRPKMFFCRRRRCAGFCMATACACASRAMAAAAGRERCRRSSIAESPRFWAPSSRRAAAPGSSRPTVGCSCDVASRSTIWAARGTATG